METCREGEEAPESASSSFPAEGLGYEKCSALISSAPGAQMSLEFVPQPRPLSEVPTPGSNIQILPVEGAPLGSTQSQKLPFSPPPLFISVQPLHSPGCSGQARRVSAASCSLAPHSLTVSHIILFAPLPPTQTQNWLFPSTTDTSLTQAMALSPWGSHEHLLIRSLSMCVLCR